MEDPWPASSCSPSRVAIIAHFTATGFVSFAFISLFLRFGGVIPIGSNPSCPVL